VLVIDADPQTSVSVMMTPKREAVPDRLKDKCWDFAQQHKCTLVDFFVAACQEWKAVSILNVVDGCIPSDLATGTIEEIEEERRLLYVGMTRAKDELNLIVPQRFYTHQQARSGDRHVYAGRTRFIPANLCEHFARVSWPPARRGEVRTQTTSAPIDIRERMRGMWSKVS
jgi:superfamily I DNA/RNA helicase